MQYIWIVMLAIADLLWIIASVADVVHTIKNKDRGFDSLTKACGITHLAILFLVSFLLWLYNIVLLGGIK